MSFKLDIQRFNAAVEDKANKVFRGVGLSMLSRVVMRTPVDTGRLKGNWQAEINAPSSGSSDEEDSAGGKTINKGYGKMKPAKFGDSIYIVNNLPYAQAIEDGHGKKNKPGGMVKVSVQEFVRECENLARKAR